MATIRELVVKMAVDPSGVSAGLQRATRDVTAFSGKALEIADRVNSLASSRLKLRFSGQEISRGAADAVQKLVSNLTSQFESKKAQIEQLFASGLLSDRQAEQQGRRAAQAYTTGLTQGLQSLTTLGVLKPGQGGQFLNAAAIDRQFEDTATSGRRFQTRMANVSVGIAFAFDAMTRSASAGEGALRRVFRSMGTLAVLAFEPPTGIVIAALLAGTDAVIDAFERQTKAAEAARRKFQETAIDIERSYDIMRAATQKQIAFSGDPFARRGVGTNILTGQAIDPKETQEQFLARSQGVLGLTKLQAQLTDQVRQDTSAVRDNISAWGSLGSGAAGSAAIAVRAQTPLQKQLAAVNELLKQQQQFNQGAGETLDRVTKHTAEIAANVLEIWQSTKLPKNVADEAERLVGIYDMLNKKHQATLPLANAVLGAYDKVTEQLRKLQAQGKTAFDPLVEGLLRAKGTLEQTGIVEMLRLGRVPSAPAVSAMFQGAQGPTGQALQVPAGITSEQFAQSVAIREAERIREALVDVLSRGGIRPATGFGGAPLSVAPAGGAITGFDVIIQTVKDKFSKVGDAIGATLIASFGPIAILMRALEPAIRALTPLFDRLAVPIALVARVLVAEIEPVLRALWPILRTLGIASTLVGEVMARISAAIAQAVGGLIKAIGNLIAKIPGLGGVGHSIANFGQSILNFGAGAKEAADEFARTRKELQGMTWDQTAQALEDLTGAANQASDALNNIPSGFRINRAIFLASQPVNAANMINATGTGSGPSNYFAPGSITINTQRPSGDELLDEVSRAARDRSMARTGTTANAASVIG